MIIEKFLTPNKWSRPITYGDVYQRVEGIVMHWTENAGAPNRVHWNWWEGRQDGNNGYGSAHYLIDKIEIWYTIPENEVAYHVGAGPFPSDRYTEKARKDFSVYPSARTIGIELCHPTEEGWFEEEVLWKAVWLAAGICTRYNLNPFFQIYRHYDITGKMCPKYWVQRYIEFSNWKRSVVRASEALKKIKEGT